jgi:PAS domain S-box-containing protein
MDIKNQIRLSVIISLVLVAIISVSIVHSYQTTQDLRQQESLAAGVVRGGYELNYLSNDYLINAEPRARAQWEERYASLQPIINQLNAQNSKEAQSIENIRDYNEKIGAQFREISEPGTLRANATHFSSSYQQVTFSRMNIQSQGMIYDAWGLRYLYNDDVTEARYWNNLLVIVLMATMLVIIGVNYLLISRRLVTSIREVDAGSAAFAAGNLDYRIPLQGTDEIGNIGAGLNAMAAHLKIITSSRDELDREVDQRRLAEMSLIAKNTDLEAAYEEITASEEELRANIKKLENSQQSLRESEEKFRTLFEDMTTGVFFQNSDGTLIDVNPAALRMFGLTREQFLGRDSYDPHWKVVLEDGALLLPEQHPSMVALRSGKPVRDMVVGIYNPKMNDFTWVSINAEPQFRPGETTPYQVFLTMSDITARKAAEESQQESEIRFSELYDTVSSGVAIYEIRNDGSSGTDYIIKDFNKAALALEGKKKEEVVGKSLSDLRPTIDDYGLIPIFREVWKTGSPAYYPATIYVDEKYANYYENRVFRLPGGEIVSIYDDVTLQKRAENELLAAREWLGIALRAAHAGTWDWDILTGKMTWSLEFFALFGLSPSDDSSFDTWRAAVHPDDRERAEASINQSIKEHSDLWNEYRIILPDGQVRWIGAGGSTVYAAGGEPVRMSGVCIDITARIRAEEDLKESEEKYRELFDNITVGFALHEIILDDAGRPVDYRFLLVNEAFEKMTGLKGPEIINHTVLEIIPTTEPYWIETYGHVALFGMPAVFEDFAVGLGKWFEVRAYSPKHGQFVTIVNDITERKQAEEAVITSEVRYRRLFESAKDGILILNRETSEIIDANPFIKSLTGYVKEELIGKKLWDIGFFKDQFASKIAFEELQKNDYIRYEDLPLEIKDGRRIEVEFISNVYPIGKNLSVIQCSIRDITDRKNAEIQRETLIKELEQKNTELERFNYTVSHDLKSPLITIKWFAGLLEEDTQKYDPVQMKKDAHRIIEAAGTMEALLLDLLELSRVGRLVKPPEMIGFGTIVNEAADILAVPLNERRVTVEIAPDLPIVNVDHPRIREAMVNLIENAIKFTGNRPDPVIKIGVDDTGEIPVFFVQDNGIGIDPRYLERIFNLFERLDISTHGTGIGLVIVRRIIEVHGGKIWAESEGAGKGTTFWFTLPGSGENTAYI